MNLFKKNDKNNSTTKNNSQQGIPMKTSNDMKPIAPAKPINPVKSVVNQHDAEEKKSALVPQSEQAPQGIKK